jgi:intein/homing endonuclease
LELGDFVFTPWIKNRKIKDIEQIDISKYFSDCKDSLITDDYIVIKKPLHNQLSAIKLAKLSGLSKYAVLRLKHQKGSRPSTVEKVSKILKKLGTNLQDWIELDNYKYVKIKRFIRVDNDFCKLIGRWIGDGWITKSGNNWGLCFNTSEVEDIEFYVTYLKSLGIELYENIANDRQLVQYTFRCNGWYNFFKKIFPLYDQTSRTKYMSVFKYLPDDKLTSVLEGLVGADGHVRKKHGSQYNLECIDTTSLNLLEDIRESLLYLKIPSSVNVRKPFQRKQKGMVYNCRQSYKINFTGITQERSRYYNFKCKEGYFSPITGIDRDMYDDCVYDISVEKDTSYTTVDYVVHNSAGGFLLSYLMGITHIDPIKYGLYSSRFLTIDRIQQGNIPDFDGDFESRIPLVGKDGDSGYLYNKYGNKAAQMSTRTLLRIKSAILDANRFMNGGKVEDSVAELSKSLPTTPQGVEDKDFVFGYEDDDGNHQEGLLEKNNALQKYAVERPQEWEIVTRALSLARQFSRHACSYAVADRPIEDIVPIFEVGGVNRVTQPESKQCEFAGLIKYDFLVVSSLKDIRFCLDYINEKNTPKDTVKMETGHFIDKGKKTFIWDLPEDPDVFKMLAHGKTETVFQLNTVSVTPFVKRIQPQNITDCAVITSLVRPGPLDFKDKDTGRNMVEEYTLRRHGQSEGKIDILNKMIPETYGVIVFQEQVTKLAKDLANMSVIDSENVRIAVGKKKKKLIESLKPKFIEGASEKVGVETATVIWDMMETFARYGFNLSHAVAYSVISYACAYLKHYYPLEWWAGVLSNAKDKEINETFYKYVKDMVLPPDINLSTERMSIDYSVGKIRNKLSMIAGIGNKSAEKIVNGRPYSNIQDFVNKKVSGAAMTRKLIHVGVLDSLFSPTDTLLVKMKKFEDATQISAFEDKMESYDIMINKAQDEKTIDKLTKNKNTFFKKGPKPSVIDDLYIGLTPVRDYQIKKNIFPTMNLDLNKIVIDYSNTEIIKKPKYPVIINNFGEEFPLLTGEQLQQIDETNVAQAFRFCVPAYIIDASEFSYQKGSKLALKLILDSSGYVSEKVLWPNYDTGVLEYSPDLKKGAVCFFFYYKKPDKPYTNIIDIKIEEKCI